MKVKGLLIVFIFFFHFNSFSQSDSTIYNSFYADFVSLYKDMSKQPLKNYYELLSDAAKFTFTPLNPLFVKTITNISQENKIAETAALDTLFYRVFKQIRNKDLWITKEDTYTYDEEIFTIYNNSFCPCLSSKVGMPDKMDQTLKAVQSCNAALLKDTSFIKALAKTGISNFYKAQQYFSMFVYAKCEILNHKQNESIRNSTIYPQYFDGISYIKSKDGESVIRFFKNKQFDSLAIIFPGYKKFIPELNNILIKTSGFSKTMNAHFEGNTTDNIPKVVLSYTKNEKDTLLREVIMQVSSNTINAKIISIKYSVSKRSDDMEQIVMPAQ